MKYIILLLILYSKNIDILSFTTKLFCFKNFVSLVISKSMLPVLNLAYMKYYMNYKTQSHEV